MNCDQVKGNWKQLSGNTKAKWGNLTDDDLQEASGDREALEGKDQVRYVKSKEEARDAVDEFLAEQD